MNSRTDASNEEMDCPNCGGIHYGSAKCPYTPEQGSIWRNSTSTPNIGRFSGADAKERS